MSTNPELHLWRCVLRMGLHDAAKGSDTRWLSSADFETVCALAGVEPDAVRRCYRPDRLATFKRFSRAA